RLDVSRYDHRLRRHEDCESGTCRIPHARGLFRLRALCAVQYRPAGRRSARVSGVFLYWASCPLDLDSPDSQLRSADADFPSFALRAVVGAAKPGILNLG